MLLIGDIHANARHIHTILQQLQLYIARFPDEKNIIFMGDYMYMFSYDRQALGELFDYFLQLWRDGRNVYIVAGNHDWLNQHFVYHEGKKVADILNGQAPNKLYFITEPEIHIIEGKEILFMPYNKKFLGDYARRIGSAFTDEGNEAKKSGKTYLEKDSSLHSEGHSLFGGGSSIDTAMQTNTLLQSKNYNEQLSGALNHYLLQHYKPGMTLIHHYYTAQTIFPGQQAKFDYKDIALHPAWMSTASHVISGHLHKAFSHENYLCVGSVRSTTSGERNHCKRLWKRDTKNDIYEAYEIAINPYVSSNSATLSIQDLREEMDTIRHEHIALFDRRVKIIHTAIYEMARTSLILFSPESIIDLEANLDEALKDALQDIQLKQTSSHKDMTELLDISQYNIKQSLLDWKELVKKYILSRYGDESEKYRTVLSELNIL